MTDAGRDQKGSDTLRAKQRTTAGKNAARQTRYRGWIPAEVYGPGRENERLEIELKAFTKARQGETLSPAETIQLDSLYMQLFVGFE